MHPAVDRQPYGEFISLQMFTDVSQKWRVCRFSNVLTYVWQNMEFIDIKIFCKYWLPIMGNSLACKCLQMFDKIYREFVDFQMFDKMWNLLAWQSFASVLQPTIWASKCLQMLGKMGISSTLIVNHVYLIDFLHFRWNIAKGKTVSTLNKNLISSFRPL